MSRRAAFLLGCAALVAATDARAGVEPRRKGFQFDAAVGLSACLPGSEARCRRVNGSTGPLAGGVLTIGYRPLAGLFTGLSFEIAGMRPSYTDILGSMGRPLYGTLRQYGYFAVVRPTIDIGRLDLGLEFGLGYTRQLAPYLVDDEPDAHFGSHGLGMRVTPLAAVYLTRRVFLGLRCDILFNFHFKSRCGSGECLKAERVAPAFGHHVLFGLMVGATI